MTANIENFARMSGTAPAWHGLGGIWSVNATIEEKAVAAGLDWTVNDSPLIYRAGNQAIVDPTRKVFYRSDRPGSVLGVMSKQFEPVQPVEMLNFLDQMSNELGLYIDTAGVLQGGAKYWALATTDDTVEPVQNDIIKRHLLVATANDGSMSTRLGPCNTRVVCQNTWNAAIARDGKNLMTINHRSRINWKACRDYLLNQHNDFQLFGDIMAEFAKIEVNAEQAADFARELIAPEWEAGKAPRKFTQFANTLSHGIGQREAGKTVYGLFNGVTRHVDHVRGRTSESRLNSAWFGAGAAMKNHAMELLIKNCVTKWGADSQMVPVVRETRYNELLKAA